VLVLTKDQGLVILNIKAVGDTFKEIQDLTQDKELQLIHKVTKIKLVIRKSQLGTFYGCLYAYNLRITGAYRQHVVHLARDLKLN
jgi:hypothetical protein